MKIILSILLIISVVLLSTGCPGEPKYYDSYMSSAEYAFKAGGYYQAMSSFYSAENYARSEFTDETEKNEKIGAARMGAAWSFLRGESPRQSISTFNTIGLISSERGYTSADKLAGLAFAYSATRDYKNSNAYSDSTLQADSDWKFLLDTMVTVRDLRVLIAENYFLMAEYDKSLTAIQVVKASFTANVSTSAGRAALAAEIERQKSPTVQKMLTAGRQTKAEDEPQLDNELQSIMQEGDQ